MMIGDCIKFWRETRNFTEEYMAHELGISQSAYSKLEKGKIKLDADRLFRIAVILKVGLEELSPHVNNISAQANRTTQSVGVQSQMADSQLANSERELYEKLISEKEKLIGEKQETILILKNLLAFFQGIKEKNQNSNANTGLTL